LVAEHTRRLRDGKVKQMLVEEAGLLCANCHAEVEGGSLALPS
jgi:hypothetical protein